MDPLALWQVLDVGSIWMKEFTSALSGCASVAAWRPVMSWSGAFENWQRVESSDNPPLEAIHFPLQRGYARWPLRWMLPFEDKLLARLRSRCSSPERSPLICSTPFYAPVAEKWPGPVIYYSTDLTSQYDGLNSVEVRKLDERMCQAAQLVCPNSQRIATYFVKQANCPAGKIVLIPNATRESNISSEPLEQPGRRPNDIAHLRGPVGGVIGNLSSNMDWELLRQVIPRTPYLQWVFVGPTTMPVKPKAQAAARDWVMAHAVFTGPKSYGELQSYARAFDVAILPYRKKEPTYSGSSTRFYEHLAACRPMVGTKGFAELLEKQPLIQLVDTADQMIDALAALREQEFSDGWETVRWAASKMDTWQQRAWSMKAALENRLTGKAEPARANHIMKAS